jgi:hypothetical protein
VKDVNGAVHARDEQHVAVADVDRVGDDAPAAIVRCGELLHAAWDVLRLEDLADDGLTLIL